MLRLLRCLLLRHACLLRSHLRLPKGVLRGLRRQGSCSLLRYHGLCLVHLLLLLDLWLLRCAEEVFLLAVDWLRRLHHRLLLQEVWLSGCLWLLLP